MCNRNRGFILFLNKRKKYLLFVLIAFNIGGVAQADVLDILNIRSLSGAVGTILFPELKPQIRILMYHRVNPDKNLPDMHIVVTPDNFKKQMQWLASNNWKVISLSKAATQIHNKKIETLKQVVITFDDGYQDNYEYAFPVLKSHNFPATIFLVSSRMQGYPEFLNIDQIMEMKANKISFGSHTITHPDLTDIDTIKANKQIILSKQQIETKLNISVDSFAYPNGRFNAIHCRQLANAGYKIAVTIAPGGNYGKEDLFMLKRTEIAYSDSMFDFRNKLKGGFDWRHRYVQRKQGLYPVPQQGRRK